MSTFDRMRRYHQNRLRQQPHVQRGEDATRADADEYFAGERNWLNIRSGNLHSVAFLPREGDAGILRVRFLDEPGGHAKSEYEYRIPIRLWEGLLRGTPRDGRQSHGVYFCANIRLKGYGDHQIW